MSSPPDLSNHSIDSKVSGVFAPSDEEKDRLGERPQSPKEREDDGQGTVQVYKMYRRRYVGMVGVVLLNIVGGMTCPWFGPVANSMVTDWDITLSQNSWLGNIAACVYLPVALAMPTLIARYGIRRCCDIGAACLLIGGWIRFSGTSPGLSSDATYALFVLGQAFSSVSQTVFQVMAPVYSEKWFDVKSRTTATTICSIANPIGSGLGQLISPIPGDTKQSILILAIISTAIVPSVLLVQSEPPTPPSYSASHKPPSFTKFLRQLFGRSDDPTMTTRNRIDFFMILIVFGLLVAATNTFALLTSTIMAPVGYDDDTSGLMGATLLLSGIVGAFVISPLMDRVFTRHLALTLKCFVPCLAGAWLSLIWAVKPNNTGGLFAVMAIIGITSITLLPVGLELGCDVTRDAEASSSLMWFSGNAFCIIFLLSEDALRAPADASPPLNMRNAMIFQGVGVTLAATITLFIQGKQVRKELDIQKAQEAATTIPMSPH